MAASDSDGLERSFVASVLSTAPDQHTPYQRNAGNIRLRRKRPIATPILAGQLPTPANAAVDHPIVSATPRFAPHRWRKARTAFGVERQRPSWGGLRQQHQLNRIAATARALHTDAPRLAIVFGQHQVAPGQFCGQNVRTGPQQSTPRTQALPGVTPPSAEPSNHGFVARSANAGRPSSGSRAPRPRSGFGALSKLSSAKKSSSQPARLKRVRA